MIAPMPAESMYGTPVRSRIRAGGGIGAQRVLKFEKAAQRERASQAQNPASRSLPATLSSSAVRRT